jgi:hypothetical protein
MMVEFNIIIGFGIVLIFAAALYRLGFFDKFRTPTKIHEREAIDLDGSLVEFCIGGERVIHRVEKAIAEGEFLNLKFYDKTEEIRIPKKCLVYDPLTVLTRDPDEVAAYTDYDVLSGQKGPIAMNAESAGALALDVAHADNEHLKAENQMLRTASDEAVRRWIALNNTWKRSLNIPMYGPPKGGYGGKSYGGGASYDEEGD